VPLVPLRLMHEIDKLILPVHAIDTLILPVHEIDTLIIPTLQSTLQSVAACRDTNLTQLYLLNALFCKITSQTHISIFETAVAEPTQLPTKLPTKLPAILRLFHCSSLNLCIYAVANNLLNSI